jgi:hypothetical protein
MDELHQKMEELKKGGKENEDSSRSRKDNGTM